MKGCLMTMLMIICFPICVIVVIYGIAVIKVLFSH
jgi:hypothetical protein